MENGNEKIVSESKVRMAEMPSGPKLLSLFNFWGSASNNCGGIAQLGEHLLCKQGVSGSIPLISTKTLKGVKNSAVFGL